MEKTQNSNYIIPLHSCHGIKATTLYNFITLLTSYQKAMGAVSTVQISVVLSVVCLVVVFVGGWYLQSSLIQLNTQVMEQQYHNQEQTEQLNKRIIKQNNKISEQQLQMEQLNIIIDVLLDRNGMVRIMIYTTRSL